MHPFEASKLGTAPFTVLEVDRADEDDKCEYCGTRIRNRYWIQGACGTKFTVGSECVKKVDKQLSKECARLLKMFKEELAMTDAERAFYEAVERIN